MELKDLILQTINEIDQENIDIMNPQTESALLDIPQNENTTTIHNIDSQNVWVREECDFLELLQERLIVLFEGLNAPHNGNQQTQLQITINFLEYILNVIQERLKLLKS